MMAGMSSGPHTAIDVPDRRQIDEAASRIQRWVRHTPVVHSGAGTFGVDHDLVLKLECLQHAGSFKVRGSFNTALAAGVPPAGLIAASGGNHGIAVAHVARALDSHAEIFVPGVSSPVKLDLIRSLGATVNIVGELYDDAQAACDERAADSGALNVHPYDAPLTVAGQATLGVELLAQVEGIDTVLVAVGGGGLAAGVAASLPRHVRLVCVEPESSRCFAAAVESGRPAKVDVSGVAADSLGAKQIGRIAWALLGDRAESVLVSDDEIIGARRRLWDEARVVAEHGGATALAALTSGRFRPEPDELVAVIVCGSNTNPRDLID